MRLYELRVVDGYEVAFCPRDEKAGTAQLLADYHKQVMRNRFLLDRVTFSETDSQVVERLFDELDLLREGNGVTQKDYALFQQNLYENLQAELISLKAEVDSLRGYKVPDPEPMHPNARDVYQEIDTRDLTVNQLKEFIRLAGIRLVYFRGAWALRNCHQQWHRIVLAENKQQRIVWMDEHTCAHRTHDTALKAGFEAAVDIIFALRNPGEEPKTLAELMVTAELHFTSIANRVKQIEAEEEAIVEIRGWDEAGLESPTSCWLLPEGETASCDLPEDPVWEQIVWESINWMRERVHNDGRIYVIPEPNRKREDKHTNYTPWGVFVDIEEGLTFPYGDRSVESEAGALVVAAKALDASKEEISSEPFPALEPHQHTLLGIAGWRPVYYAGAWAHALAPTTYVGIYSALIDAKKRVLAKVEETLPASNLEIDETYGGPDKKTAILWTATEKDKGEVAFVEENYDVFLSKVAHYLMLRPPGCKPMEEKDEAVAAALFNLDDYR